MQYEAATYLYPESLKAIRYGLIVFIVFGIATLSILLISWEAKEAKRRFDEKETWDDEKLW